MDSAIINSSGKSISVEWVFSENGAETFTVDLIKSRIAILFRFSQNTLEKKINLAYNYKTGVICRLDSGRDLSMISGGKELEQIQREMFDTPKGESLITNTLNKASTTEVPTAHGGPGKLSVVLQFLSKKENITDLT
jgi:hypothetical protein